MRRIIQSRTGGASGPPESLAGVPSDLVYSLDAATYRGAMRAVVRAGDSVNAGQPIAEGEWQVLHTPLAGTVQASEAGQVIIQPSEKQPAGSAVPRPVTDRKELPDYLRAMGLVGMGGGRFPYAQRIARILDAPPHTLVINAVECEPGIDIDESLMIHQHRNVFAGVEAFTRLLGLRRCVLAVRKSARPHLASAVAGYSVDWLEMPDQYPGGAGKLITARLLGRMPGAGMLNTDLGFLISNVASLWAFGRRLLDGCPSVERPLTVMAPGMAARRIVAPIGASAGYVLNQCGILPDAEKQVLVAEGRMMGREAGLDFRIGKGTNALMVLPIEQRLVRAESPCILCGSCFDACPLGLHPVGMVNRIRERRRSRALEHQLNECFLCGACSAVCPADIPLVQVLREGKSWMREKS